MPWVILVLVVFAVLGGFFWIGAIIGILGKTILVVVLVVVVVEIVRKLTRGRPFNSD
jgi:hypothetical protein